MGKSSMVVVSAHIPKSHLRAIELLSGEHGIYPSRSEYIRSAVKRFLMKELKKLKESQQIEQEDGYVKIPVGNGENGGERYETYKIVEKIQ